MTFPNARRIRLAPSMLKTAISSGSAMMIEMKTKRRWIVSVLEAVAEGSDDRIAARANVRQNTARKLNPGQKGFAMRLKAATRPLADAAR
jgi:hypothetical protein